MIRQFTSKSLAESIKIMDDSQIQIEEEDAIMLEAENPDVLFTELKEDC